MQTLYNDLTSLCYDNDSFYYKDIRLDSINYRIFNYRLCSYVEFQSCPVALNCRGIMFNITNPNDIQLVCLPPEKFFNYNEGFGQSKQHEKRRFGDKMEKMDGSLISTFLHRTDSNVETLRLKSKLSLISEQAQEAMQLLKGEFQSDIERLVRLKYTVNMEYTSPSNKLFVHYAQADLTILSIRSHLNGETLFGTRLRDFLLANSFPVILQHLVAFEQIPSDISHSQLLQSIQQQTQGEGCVVEIIRSDQSSYLVKIKTQKYLIAHSMPDNSNSPRSLFEAVIYENSDDLKSLFHNDNETLEKIIKMEEKIKPQYNQMIESIEQFHKKYKHLSKREFKERIKRTENIKIYLRLLMKLYVGKDNDYKAFAVKHAKDLFGIYQDEKKLITTNNDNDE
jgi:T4 RnlA family RNA ligase